MALTLDDMGAHWTRVTVGSQSVLYATSVCHVGFQQGGYYAPVVQNTVAVYRTVDGASNAYDQDKPSSASLSTAAIGDECFINDSNPVDKRLQFRKNNVLVSVVLKNFQSGDLERFARIVESRISP
jgi:hypothetical protein